MIRIPHLDIPAGESMAIYLYNWTSMMLGLMYNHNDAVDALSGKDWPGIETDNNAMAKRIDRRGWIWRPDQPCCPMTIVTVS